MKRLLLFLNSLIFFLKAQNITTHYINPHLISTCIVKKVEMEIDGKENQRKTRERK